MRNAAKKKTLKSPRFGESRFNLIPVSKDRVVRIPTEAAADMIPVGIDIGTQSVFVGCYAQNQCRPMTKTAEIVLDRFSRRRILFSLSLWITR